MPKKLNQKTLDALNSLGSSKNDFDAEGQLDAIEQAAGEFIKRIHQNLEAEDAIVSGKIADIQLRREGNSIEIIANRWLVYQDKGVNGSVEKRYNTPFEYTTKKPPVQEFIDWVKARNIQTRNNEKHSGKKQSFHEAKGDSDIKSIAYAIRENVFKYGIKPQNVYSKEIPQLVEDVKQNIIDFSIQNIKEQFKTK